MPRLQSSLDTPSRLAILVVLETAPIAVVSGLHLGSVLDDGHSPFDPTQAGIAEGAIGLVMTTAALALMHADQPRWVWARAGVAFAIVGFLVGLGFTVSGEAWPDVSYHCVMLPVLIATAALLQRAERSRESGRPPHPSR